MATTFSESIFSVDEAAAKLGVERSVVCRYCRLGRLKARKFGNSWTITKSALDEFAKKPRERGNPTFKCSATTLPKGSTICTQNGATPPQYSPAQEPSRERAAAAPQPLLLQRRCPCAVLREPASSRRRLRSAAVMCCRVLCCC